MRVIVTQKSAPQFSGRSEISSKDCVAMLSKHPCALKYRGRKIISPKHLLNRCLEVIEIVSVFSSWWFWTHLKNTSHQLGMNKNIVESTASFCLSRFFCWGTCYMFFRCRWDKTAWPRLTPHNFVHYRKNIVKMAMATHISGPNRTKATISYTKYLEGHPS